MSRAHDDSALPRETRESRLFIETRYCCVQITFVLLARARAQRRQRNCKTASFRASPVCRPLASIPLTAAAAAAAFLAHLRVAPFSAAIPPCYRSPPAKFTVSPRPFHVASLRHCSSPSTKLTLAIVLRSFSSHRDQPDKLCRPVLPSTPFACFPSSFPCILLPSIRFFFRSLA